MEKHPIENILSSTMENLNRMIDVDKIIGHPVMTPEGGTVLPVSQVSFGFASGGGEYELTKLGRDTPPFAGGTGAGISLKPTGFLVIEDGVIRYLPVQPSSTVDRLIDLVPQMTEQIKKIAKEDNGGFEEA